jgi:hypothetical protein
MMFLQKQSIQEKLYVRNTTKSDNKNYKKTQQQLTAVFILPDKTMF